MCDGVRDLFEVMKTINSIEGINEVGKPSINTKPLNDFKNVDYKMDLKRELKEEVNIERLKNVVEFGNVPNLDDGDFTKIKNYYYNIVMKNKKVTYNYSKNAVDFGRLYGNGLQGIKKIVKNWICHDNDNKPLYTDIDIVNCHPVILEQLCQKHNFNCKLLSMYIKNRERCLSSVMDDHNVSRKQAKTLFIRLMYVGAYSGWKKEEKIKDDKLNNFVVLFEDEMKKIADSFYNNIEFEKYRKKSIKSKDKNPKSTCLSLILNEIENNILTVSCNCATSMNYEVSVYCFDGFMIKNQQLEDNFLTTLEKEVKNSTGFSVNYETKALDYISSYDDWLEKASDKNFDKSKINIEGRFSVSYMAKLKGDTPDMTYAMMKYYFESHFIYVMTQSSYFLIMDGNLVRKSKDSIKTEIGCVMTQYPGERRGYKKFYYVYEDDADKNILDKIDFVPYNIFSGDVPCLDYIHNSFTGYNPLILPKEEVDYSVDYIAPLIPYFKALCEGDENIYKYVMSLLARKIKDPTIRDEKILFIQSNNEGTGKSTFGKLIGDLFGKHYSTYENLENFFSRFSDRGAYSCIAQIDDLNQRGFKAKEFLGSLLTQATLHELKIEKKGMDAMDISNYALVMAFSNNADSLPINTESETNRRIVGIKVNEESLPYKCNTANATSWFKKNIFEPFGQKNYKPNPHAISQLFWFFMEFDCVQDIQEVPVTHLTREMRESQKTPGQEFMYEYFVMNKNYYNYIGNGEREFDYSGREDYDGEVHIPCKDMNEEVRSWFRNNGSKVPFQPFKILKSGYNSFPKPSAKRVDGTTVKVYKVNPKIITGKLLRHELPEL